LIVKWGQKSMNFKAEKGE